MDQPVKTERKKVQLKPRGAITTPPVIAEKPLKTAVEEKQIATLDPEPRIPTFMQERIKAAQAENIPVAIVHVPLNGKVKIPVAVPPPSAVEPEQPDESATAISFVSNVPEKVETAVVLPQKFGERVDAEIFDDANTAGLGVQHKVEAIKSKQFFSEGHKASVEAHNLLAEANSSKNTLGDFCSTEDFLKMVETGFNGHKKEDDKDNDYALAASRSVVATANTYYSVVAMHSCYKANMLGLNFLEKSQLNTVAEDPYHDRERIFKIVYRKIADMTGGKPAFEKWLKMTSYRDFPTLLYGIYASSYPGNQPFDVVCNKCNEKTSIPTDAESIIAVYDEGSYARISEILFSVKNHDEVFANASLNEVVPFPVAEKRSVLYLKDYSLFDLLESLSRYKANEEELAEYESVVDKAMFVSYAMIPDKTYKDTKGEVRWIKVTDRRIILRLLASINDDEFAGEFDQRLAEIGAKYDVRFEIPKFKCRSILKDENGKFTDKTCGNNIGPIHLDLEEILFFRVRRALDKTKTSDSPIEE